jgi:hypothetical protein
VRVHRRQGDPTMLHLVHLIAEADQLAAQARDARCCDALDPCKSCLRLRQAVVARRYLLRIPQQRQPSSDS